MSDVLATYVLAAARAIVAVADGAKVAAPVASATPNAPPAEAPKPKAVKPKPAAAAPVAAAVAPAAPTAAPKPVANGAITEEQVRNALRELGKKVSRDAAINLLDDEGDGAQNVAALKPELYATVYNAAQTAMIVGNTPAAAAKPAADDFGGDEI